MSDDLSDVARRFCQLESTFESSVRDEDWLGAAGILHEARQVSFRLRYLMSREGAVANGAGDVGRVLRQFQNGDSRLLRMVDDTDAGQLPEDLAAGLPPGGGWYPDAHLSRLLDPEDPDFQEPIIRRLLAAGVVVSKRQLPAWVSHRLLTARRCFALALYAATWVFLRALIEAASYDWLTTHGGRATATGVLPIFERQPLGKWLGSVLSQADVPVSVSTRVWNVVRRANEVVHAKQEQPSPTEADTLAAIKAVTAYVERLFP